MFSIVNKNKFDAMETVLVTGGTGLIGTALTRTLLERNYKVIVLTRNPAHQQPDHPNLSFAGWDIEKQEIDANAVAAADHIIHMAGAGVADKRWTTKRKSEIVDSRVKSGHLLVRSLKVRSSPVRTVISISGIGWYGPDRDSKSFVETDPAANDFLARTCKQWEASIEPVKDLGKRLVIFRTGIVLSNKGGAIKEFTRPLRFGFATPLGSGKQIISWIYIDDLVKLFLYAMENPSLQGVYNAVSPDPVSNKELFRQLAKANRKFYITVHVPAFVLRIVLGEVSIEVLKSATVSSKKTEETGFSFQYPTIRSAIQKLAVL
jgi:uncharacterized protein (TIGR01777 family)